MHNRSKMDKFFGGLLCAALTAVAGLSALPAQATTVDLGTAPPDLSSAVNPNVVVTFDDSGSMGATALPDAMADDYNSKFYYDPRQNLIYFDPMKEYPPPLKPDGTPFPDANYNAAWRDGICANYAGTYCYGSANTKDLRSRFYESFGNEASTTNRPNALASNNRNIPTGVRPTGGGGFWYTCPTNNSNTACVLNTIGSVTDPLIGASDPLTQRFANWYSYYRTRNLMTRTALSRVFAGATLDNKVRVIWQTINADFGGTPAITTRQIQELTGTWKNNFFAWMFNVGNDGGTPNRRATIEAGKVFERSLTTNYMNPYYYPPLIAGGAARNLECRQNFHMLVTDGYWNEGDPGLPNPFNKVSNTVNLPDGKIYTPNTIDTKVYSNVGAYDSSIGNIAFHYWAKDLQPTLANKVPPYFPDRTGATSSTDPGATPAVYWNPANDPATWQHVVQYMVTLGIAGNLNFPGDYAALRAGSKSWPTPSNNSPPAVDDTWHASVNSRGEYFSAKNPSELVDQMTTILTNILTRRGGSTSPSVSTGILTTGTLGFVAGYDSADWSGFVLGHNIDDAGNLLQPPLWDAGCRLTGGPCASLNGQNFTAKDPNSRVILTSNGTLNSGKAFRWSALSTVQRTALNALDARGSERVDYIRGVRTAETATVPMRRRGSLLGPIVNAQPRYYGPAEGDYPNDWSTATPEGAASAPLFSDYQESRLNQQPLVYVASNDGMLHALHPDTGDERWAYVPNTLFANGKLKALTDPGVGLVPTVDDRPVIGEVFIGGRWRSVLAGTLRFGGRGMYMLDVTDSTATEAGASAKVLWEFDSNSIGGANLGYTYDSVNIARLPNGKWVALLSSGYFPKVGVDSLLPAALEDRTSLFIIDIATGQLLREIRTPAGTRSYGLSSPEVVSYTMDANSTNIDGYAFAGDLAGNLWRFDLTSTNPASWSVDLVFSTYDGVAADVGKQPISSQPIAFPDREATGSRGGIILFGTGKYLGDEDRLATGTPTQSLYGIRDYGPGSGRITKSTLIAQTLVDDTSGKRSLTNNAVTSTSKGWRIDLPALGERNVVTLTPIFVNGLAVFTTVIPAGDNPCDPSRTGAIIVVDSQDGSGPGDLLNAMGTPPAGRNWAGQMVANPPAAGMLGGVTIQGGGRLLLPGVPPIGSDGTPLGGSLSLDIIPVWRRGSWREALDVTD